MPARKTEATASAAAPHAQPSGSANGHTREEILRVARELFLVSGYAGTSASAIGKQLDISTQALYGHLPSKEAILCALIEKRLRSFLEHFRSEEREPTRD